MLWKSTCILFLYMPAFIPTSCILSHHIFFHFPILGMEHLNSFETWSLAPHCLIPYPLVLHIIIPFHTLPPISLIHSTFIPMLMITIRGTIPKFSYMLWKITCLLFLHTLAFVPYFHIHASFPTIFSYIFLSLVWDIWTPSKHGPWLPIFCYIII